MKGFLIRALWKKYWKLLLSMLLVSAFGCAILTGLAGSYLSLKEGLDTYIRGGGYPDVIVTTDVTERGRMEKLKAVPGVEDVNARLIGDVTLIGPEGRYLSIRAMSFDADDFQKCYFWEQAEQTAYDPIYLEYSFAQNAGIRAGDAVQIKAGDEYRQYSVAAIVSRPETLAMEASDDVSIVSEDFGYAYAPRALLEKEVNADHRDAVQEWEEKSSDLSDAEQSARQEYESARHELDSAQAELNEKKAAFQDQLKALNEQLSDLKSSKEALEITREELGEKKAEAESSQRELGEKKAEAEEKRQELFMAQRELDHQRAELEKTETALLDQQSTLTAQREEAQEQLLALQSAKEELLSGLDMLEDARAEALEERGELIALRAQLAAQRAEAEAQLDRLYSTKKYLALLEEAAEASNAEADLYQRTVASIEALGQLLHGAEAMGQYLKQEETDALQSRLDALRDGFSLGGSVSEAMLDDAIARCEDGLAQIDDGFAQIDEGLSQIDQGLQEADEKETELEGGLQQIEEGEAALSDALLQMDDGLWQMEEGLAQIADGYKEMDDYQAQIDGGFAELADAFTQMDDYQKQLDEGLDQLKAGEMEIDAGLLQIADGEAQIQSAIAEADRQLAEGESQLIAARTEMENGWIQMLSEFSDLKGELQKAYDELSEWEGYQVFCNQFLIKVSSGVSPDETLRGVKAALEESGVHIKSTLLYEDSPVKRRVDNNLIPMKTLMFFIPMFFFAIAMIVVYLFMSLLIRQSRREIGILRALGFTRLRVVSLFCGAGLAVSLGAIALGFALSLVMRGFICYYFFDMFFPLPIHAWVFSWESFLLSAVLTVLVVQLATVFSASAISVVQPSEAMTRVKPPAVNIPRAVRWAIQSASPFTKFSIISLLRNPLRFLFSVICLSGSVMLIFSAISLISSSYEIMDRTFLRSMHYDCQIFVSSDAGGAFQASVEALPFVSDVERMDYYTASFSLNGYAESAAVAAVQENTRLISLEDQKGNVLSITGDGMVMDRMLAKKLGASVGSFVQMNGESIRVSAISEQCLTRFQYVSHDEARALGECALRSLLCRVPADKESEFMRFLVEQDGYLYAVFADAAYSAYAYLLEGVNIACWALIAVAMLIGLVIVVNTSQTNLLEQKRELCVLRTLGFHYRELSLHWFSQAVLHFLCSCALGFPVGVAVTKSAIQRIQMSNRSYPFVNNPRDYLITAGLVFAYIVLSHFLSMRSLKRWDFVECVKDKE